VAHIAIKQIIQEEALRAIQPKAHKYIKSTKKEEVLSRTSSKGKIHLQRQQSKPEVNHVHILWRN